MMSKCSDRGHAMLPCLRRDGRYGQRAGKDVRCDLALTCTVGTLTGGRTHLNVSHGVLRFHVSDKRRFHPCGPIDKG